MTHLQDKLKLQLIQPSGRGISITQDGQRIYQNAKMFLESERKFFFSQKDEPNPEFRIGTVEIFSRAIVDGLQNSSLKNEKIKLIDVEQGTMEQQIVAGNLDLGITYLPLPIPNLKLIPVSKFKIGCFHRGDVFRNLDFHDLPFVVPSKLLPENPQGIKERDGWHDSLSQRKIVYKTNLLSIGMELTLSGSAAIMIPHFVANIANQSIHSPHERLIERRLPEPKQSLLQTAYVICSEQYFEDQKLKALCKILRTAIKLS